MTEETSNRALGTRSFLPHVSGGARLAMAACRRRPHQMRAHRRTHRLRQPVACRRRCLGVIPHRLGSQPRWQLLVLPVLLLGGLGPVAAARQLGTRAHHPPLPSPSVEALQMRALHAAAGRREPSHCPWPCCLFASSSPCRCGPEAHHCCLGLMVCAASAASCILNRKRLVFLHGLLVR